MKNTIISARRKKTELFTLLACFVLANMANLYAIVAYNTSLAELATALGYVSIAALVLYIAWSAIRICFYGAKRAAGRRIRQHKLP
ncbi:MAG: hypothetical protein LBO71_04770 [Prevotellaceae bacterium]|jgi:hypothetical protein|nr:hypothetical protein [Prevotellaceae bacterium]